MIQVKFALLLFFAALGIVKAQSNPDAIIGTWETTTKDARMEVFRTGNSYYGKLLWGNRVVETDGKTSKKDTKNPDPQLRSRNIVGIVNLTSLQFEDGDYVNGKIYDPPSGKTYNCTAWLKNGKLHLRGFIGIPAFGQTAIWNRIK